MPIGIITGSGTYALPDFDGPELHGVDTPYGEVALTTGRFAGVDVVHLSRHGEGHQRLSNHVNFRANAWAMRELGVSAVVGCTACGALDPVLELGAIVIFDDLHFLSNRLPDGSVCTYFSEPGDRERGHWIYEGPYSEDVRDALLAGGRTSGRRIRSTGCYGHVDGPRFNTRAEIRHLQSAGVTAVSQTGGPETVLFGELQVPYGLMGFVTDYANAISPHGATPVEELIRLMGESTEAFSAVLAEALPRLGSAAPEPPGVVYRFEP